MRNWLLLPKQWSNFVIVITILEAKAMRQKITTGALPVFEDVAMDLQRATQEVKRQNKIPLVYSNFNCDPL
jgi:hypothetical protein